MEDNQKLSAEGQAQPQVQPFYVQYPQGYYPPPQFAMGYPPNFQPGQYIPLQQMGMPQIPVPVPTPAPTPAPSCDKEALIPWMLFIVGFFCCIPWFVGSCWLRSKNPRARKGAAACFTMSFIVTVAFTFFVLFAPANNDSDYYPIFPSNYTDCGAMVDNLTQQRDSLQELSDSKDLRINQLNNNIDSLRIQVLAFSGALMQTADAYTDLENINQQLAQRLVAICQQYPDAEACQSDDPTDDDNDNGTTPSPVPLPYVPAEGVAPSPAFEGRRHY